MNRDRIPPPSRMATRHQLRVGGRGSEGPSAGSRLADGQTSGDVVPGSGGLLADGQISSDLDAPSGQRGEARAEASPPGLPLTKARRDAAANPPGLPLVETMKRRARPGPLRRRRRTGERRAHPVPSGEDEGEDKDVPPLAHPQQRPQPPP